MYQCPGCGGRLVFDIPSQQLMCDHCDTKYDPYAISKEQDAEESQEYDVTVFKCPNCGQKIRIPRGHGKVSVHCRKCGHDFIGRT